MRLICEYLLRSLLPFLTCIYETLLDLEMYKIRVTRAEAAEAREAEQAQQLAQMDAMLLAARRKLASKSKEVTSQSDLP